MGLSLTSGTKASENDCAGDLYSYLHIKHFRRSETGNNKQYHEMNPYGGTV